MNPNDSKEFSLIIKTIKKELPFFSKKVISMKSDHQKLPKNMKEHSINLNEKFLNHNSDIIDEIEHRKKNKNFIQRFKQYQDKFFNIPNATCLSTASEVVINPYRFVSSCTPISEISSATSGTNDQAENDQVIWNQMTSSVSIGDCFDQVALKRGSSGTGGTYRQGVYDESGSSPNVLLAETGAISMPATSTYTYQTLAETEATTANLWQAFMQSSTTPKVLRQQTAGGALEFRNSYSYGALPSPASSTSSGNPFVSKISHTGA